MELETLVDFYGTAAWRWEKAEQYPWDKRNENAAVLLEKYGEEVADLEGSPVHKALVEVYEKIPFDEQRPELTTIPTMDEISAALRSVGFGYAPENAAAFIVDLTDSLRMLSETLQAEIEERAEAELEEEADA